MFKEDLTKYHKVGDVVVIHLNRPWKGTYNIKAVFPNTIIVDHKVMGEGGFQEGQFVPFEVYNSPLWKALNE